MCIFCKLQGFRYFHYGKYSTLNLFQNGTSSNSCKLCDYILLAGKLGVEFKTFSCKAIGLFRFMRYSGVSKVN